MTMNKYYYLIKVLRAYREVSFGQFDRETFREIKETQDAADAIEELSEENEKLKKELEEYKRHPTKSTIYIPKEQKFPSGSRVKIADDFPHAIAHPKGCFATVMYSYAQKFGGDDTESYQLDVDGIGEVAWYDESWLEKADE